MGNTTLDSRNRWWVQPLLTFIIVSVGVAASFGALQSQVTTIQKNGSEPMQDLQTRVAVLESTFKSYREENAQSHTRIESSVNKIVDYLIPEKK